MSPGIASLYMGQHLQLCLCLCHGYAMGMAMAYVILLPFAGFDFCVGTKSIIPQLLIIITQHRIMS